MTIAQLWLRLRWAKKNMTCLYQFPYFLKYATCMEVSPYIFSFHFLHYCKRFITVSLWLKNWMNPGDKDWIYSMNTCKASVTHTLQPLCDLSATTIHNDCRCRRGVVTRFCSWSATRLQLIWEWLTTDRRLVGDLVGTFLRLHATGRQPVGTGPRLIADQSPIGRRPSQLKIVIKKKNINDNIF